ncbi:MAG: membrane integrity-associated transporter subunit PqiC [Paludibacterium sp.]|uniref:PqiC family protein n=1 Tax=Paludibacterium sp. TaxID=1917523 RepID=UPI0025DEB4F3|nr:PqiC family protein [Paludibacterium sp.]MBV8046854.1 membrane integrity-associated transporter subunit PqiC [Paludibacterium sp.]MBV8646837.1 membrane integrity-associated transporter subunit PqiC [Paludibacterium sp.]
MKSPVAVTLMGLLLAACASAPVHYYSLLPAPSAPAAPRSARYAIEILPVAVPAEADRPEWVARRADGSIEILSGAQWAAPLDEEIRAAFAAELTGATGAPLADGLDAVHQPVLRLKLSLRRFDIAPHQPIQIETDWSLGAPGHARLQCAERFSARPVATDAQTLATIRQWQDALAQQIAQTVLSWRNDVLPPCP